MTDTTIVTEIAELRRVVAVKPLEWRNLPNTEPVLDGETLWCESCGEAPLSVRLEYAGLCAECAKEQGE